MMNEYDKRLNSCFNDEEIKTNFLGVCPWKRNVQSEYENGLVLHF